MSDGGERRRRDPLPAAWDRLERAGQEAANALALWRRRAMEAEEEVLRLRRALEEVAASRGAPGADLREELRRLRAENTALQSRMLQARKRIAALMKRLATLGMDP